jgi:membrane protease YdiL (CAAX protease family)
MIRIITEKLWLFLALAPLPFLILVTGTDLDLHQLLFREVLILVILYPLLEETIFRGIIQPAISTRIVGKTFLFSHANILTSIIFSLAHLFSHETIWAMAVFIPSVAFGLLKDRYKTLLAPIALHCYYNAGYFLVAV